MDQHLEAHRKESLSELVLGGQDGLVNVLGLALGVAASSGNRNIILAAGFAAALAESVSMAAVVYTSLIAKIDHYQSELERERREVIEMPEAEKEETREIYRRFGFAGDALEKIVDIISQDHEKWVQLMMSEELRLEPITRESVLPSSFKVGIATIVGSLIPIAPFIFFSNVRVAVALSVFVSAAALFVVGAYKAKISVGKWYKSGTQMLLIGLVAAIIGYVVGSLFGVSGK